MNIRHEVLDWFGPSRELIVICPILMYYAIEIDSSLSFRIFWGVSGDFPSGCPSGSILSIYSRETILYNLVGFRF
jgi:hypothetical protein